MIDRHRIEALWARRDLGLREKTLWRLLYDSAARIGEDLDLDAKRGRAIRKGGDIHWILWECPAPPGCSHGCCAAETAPCAPPARCS